LVNRELPEMLQSILGSVCCLLRSQTLANMKPATSMFHEGWQATGGYD